MSESKETLQRFKQDAIERLSQGRVVNERALFPEDVEGIVEELASLVQPFIASTVQSTEAARLANEGMTTLQYDLEMERLRRRFEVSDERLAKNKLEIRVQEQEVAELRARLFLLELNEELRKAGFEYPQGIAGLREAMDLLKRYRRWADAFEDFINRIADIEGRVDEDGPGEPTSFEDAMLRLDQIRDVIKEFDRYER